MKTDNRTFDEMRADLFKEMDNYCKEKKITREELNKQLVKAESRRYGNYKVTKK